MALTPQMETALEAPALAMFVAVTTELPGATLRLLDGSGVLTVNGEIHTGEDVVYGVLAGIEAFEDGVGAEAPRLGLTLHPASNAAAALLANPAHQGSPVYVWEGVVEPVSGQVVPDPVLVFLGEVDQPILQVGRGQRTLTLDCSSVWERFFDRDEGFTLTDAFHQSVYPGDLGLEFVTSVTQSLPWGADQGRPSIKTAIGRLQQSVVDAYENQ